jgi:hypothetical protein
MESFLTVGEVVKKLDCPIWRVQWLLRTCDVKPIGRAGVLRLYEPNVMDVLQKELDSIQKRRDSMGCTT